MATFNVICPDRALTAFSLRHLVELAVQSRYGVTPWIQLMPDEDWVREYERGQFVVGVSGVSHLPYRTLGSGSTEESAWYYAFRLVQDYIEYWFGEGAQLDGPYFC